MKIAERIYMIGSSEFGLSDPGDCHIYLVDTEPDLVMIDAGGVDAPDAAIENMRRDGLDPLKLTHILLTHAHRDHAGALSAWKGVAESGVVGPFITVTSAEEARLIESGTTEELGLDLLGFGDTPRKEAYPPVSVDRRIADGDRLDIGELSFTGIVVPGHNPGCVCYYVHIGDRNVLFCGDVLACGGYISIGNWPGSSNVEYRKALPKLSGLEIDALFPSHHMWTLENGQQHVDKAIAGFDGLWPPPAVNQVLG